MLYRRRYAGGGEGTSRGQLSRARVNTTVLIDAFREVVRSKQKLGLRYGILKTVLSSIVVSHKSKPNVPIPSHQDINTVWLSWSKMEVQNCHSRTERNYWPFLVYVRFCTFCVVSFCRDRFAYHFQCPFILDTFILSYQFGHQA